MKLLAAVSLISFAVLAQTANATSVLIPQRDTRVINYSVLNDGAKVSDKHVPNFGGGTATINYFEQTVSLSLYEHKVCPVGFSCTQEIRGIFKTMNIVETKINDCGIVTVIAKEDQRPVDGALEVITLEDSSRASCKFFVPYVNKGTYLTSYVNRMTGKNVTVKSKFNLELVDITVAPLVADAYFQLIDGEYTRGFDSISMSHGTLLIGQDAVTVTVYNVTTCPPNAACKLGPARTVELTLPIVSRENTGCSDKITALQVLNNTGMYQQIEITDYSNSICEMYYKYPVIANYEMIEPSAMYPIQSAVFHFGPYVIPMIK